MTTARAIITNALSFRLNVLSPGEAIDPDIGARCLLALNDVVDRINGGKSFLFREILTRSTAITGKYGTLGTDWASIAAGDQILGATVEYATGLDVPMDPITMGQYANVAIKALTTYPAYYAHDGQSQVFLYPAATGHYITIRTGQVFADFADLDTDYTMPKGYQSALADLVAERVAPSLLGQVPAPIFGAAESARNRLAAQAVVPAILGGSDVALGPVARIRRGF